MDLQLIGSNKVLLAVDDGYREFALADGKELKAFKGVLGGRTHNNTVCWLAHLEFASRLELLPYRIEETHP